MLSNLVSRTRSEGRGPGNEDGPSLPQDWSISPQSPRRWYEVGMHARNERGNVRPPLPHMIHILMRDFNTLNIGGYRVPTGELLPMRYQLTNSVGGINA